MRERERERDRLGERPGESKRESEREREGEREEAKTDGWIRADLGTTTLNGDRCRLPNTETYRRR